MDTQTEAEGIGIDQPLVQVAAVDEVLLLELGLREVGHVGLIGADLGVEGVEVLQHHLVQVHVRIVGGIGVGDVGGDTQETGLGERNRSPDVHHLGKMVVQEHLGQGQEDAVHLLGFLVLGLPGLLRDAVLGEELVEVAPAVAGVTVVDEVHRTALYTETDRLGELTEVIVPGVHSPVRVVGIIAAGHEGARHHLVGRHRRGLGRIVILAVEILRLAGGEDAQGSDNQDQGIYLFHCLVHFRS